MRAIAQSTLSSMSSSLLYQVMLRRGCLLWQVVEYCQQLLEQGYTQEQVDEYVQSSCQPDAPWQPAEIPENGHAQAQVGGMTQPVCMPALAAAHMFELLHLTWSTRWECCLA